MMDKLRKQLNHLWAGEITYINFDLLKKSVTINIIVTENEKTENFEVIFINVSAYYFINNNGENRFDFYEVEQDDYLELTSIDYIGREIKEIKINSHSKWVDEYFSSANFLLEIWSSIVLIEAESIKINGIAFENLLRN